MEIKNMIDDYINKAFVNKGLREMQAAKWREIPSANSSYNLGFDSNFHGTSLVVLGIDGNKVFMADTNMKNDLKSSLVCASLSDFTQNPFPLTLSCGKLFNYENGKFVCVSNQSDFDRAKNLANITKKSLEKGIADNEERLIHKKVRYSLVKFAMNCAIKHKNLTSDTEYTKLQKSIINSANFYTDQNGKFSGEEFIYKHRNCFVTFGKERAL